MKKLATLTLALMLALTAFVIPVMAEESSPVRIVGLLSKANMPEDELNSMLEDQFKMGWCVFEEDHTCHFQYYDELSSIILALNAGTIDECALPRFVAEYIAKVNPELKICCVERMPNDMSLLFGFRDDEGGRDLQTRMNEAIGSMKADGALDALKHDYLDTSSEEELTPVQFDAFPESGETIRVAVTGDLPPLDYVGEDGIPAGFNTAVLAEIGRRLGVNIELVSMQTGSRTLALVSNTVDAVFWYMDLPSIPADLPEGILFSDPYISWDMWLHIRKA